MFTIIGERINMTRKEIKEKVWERDDEYPTISSSSIRIGRVWYGLYFCLSPRKAEVK